ncbi:uncharacterized protein LOC119998727 [Tripterygium wilfordii]|uniref:uncharacterized protein LOC119998727 n=1 Tax=Tripterygium wilfordii TaxID=458696 RepID=UPI0018F7FEF1|nr:uncharacterized protein LOC119998727 [Tripterygium wilfordii]
MNKHHKFVMTVHCRGTLDVETGIYTGGSKETCMDITMEEWGTDEMRWWINGLGIDFDNVAILYRKPWRAQCHGLKLLEDEEDYIEMGWMGVEDGSVHMYVDHTNTYTPAVYLQHKIAKKTCGFCGYSARQNSPTLVICWLLHDFSKHICSVNYIHCSCSYRWSLLIWMRTLLLLERKKKKKGENGVYRD